MSMAMLGAEALKYGMKWKQQDSKPSFKKSAMGQYYAKKKAHGLLGDKNVKNMANQYGKYVNRNVDDNVSNYKGSLINKNMGNSIAGIRGVNEVKSEGNQKIEDYKAKLMQQNEQSKIDMADKYALHNAQYDEEIRKNKEQAFNDFAGNVAGGMLSGATSDGTLSSLSKNIDFSDPNADLQSLIDGMMDLGYKPEEIEQYILMNQEDPLKPKLTGKDVVGLKNPQEVNTV